MKKKLLVLGGSYFQIPAIQYAKSAGYYVITCDYLPDNPGHRYADEYHNVSTTDVDGVLRLAQRLKIDGIIAYASDPAAPTAAYVGNKLGLPSNSVESVNILSDKILYRQHLSQNGFNTPRAIGIATPDETQKITSQFTFPLMVKPADSSGSKGISKIEAADQISSAFEYAIPFSRSRKCIVEEYVEKKGPQIGGEAFVLDGELISIELGDQMVDPLVNKLVPCGMTFPSSVSDQTRQEISRQLQRLIDTTGFQFGGMNLEVMLDHRANIYLMEVSARTGGNFLPELVSYFAPIDYTQSSVELAMGNAIHLNKTANSKSNGCYAYYAIHSNRKSTLNKLRISSQLDPYVIEKHIFKSHGDSLEVFNGANQAIGILLLHFNNRTEMNEMIERSNMHIKVILQ